MWFDADYLKLCEKIARVREVSPEPRAGMRISRGFADVGYEEFVVLPNGKLMSLFTGQQSELAADHRGFFFEVPPIEWFIDEITKTLHGRLPEIHLDSSGAWNVKSSESKVPVSMHRDLAFALAHQLLSIIAPDQIESGM